MKAAKYTSGPWSVEPLQWDHGASIAVVAKGQIICVIALKTTTMNRICHTAKRGPDDEANAALIAASPEQNSFIRQIARMTMDGENDFIMEKDDAVSALNQLIEEARDLLIKAEVGGT